MDTIAKSLFKHTMRYEEKQPRYTIDNQRITIYNFVSVDENGYQDTQDFIELVPKCESYNLLDNKSRKISVRKCALFDNKQREIIINAIRAALIETNQASQTSNIYILNGSTCWCL